MIKKDSIEMKWYFIGMILMLLGVIPRLLILGWAGFIGFGSMLLLVPFHLYYLISDKNLPAFSRPTQLLILAPMFIFPFIFLFQPDFGDSGGIYVAIEWFIGNKKRPLLENYSWIFALICSFSYLMILLKVFKKLE